MKEELLKGLSDEQIAKLRACKNQEEMLAVAKEEGVELTDDQLEAVTGGVCGSTRKPNAGGAQTNVGLRCPKCGSTAVVNADDTRSMDESVFLRYECKSCTYCW